MNQQLEYLMVLQELDLRIRILDNEISLMPEEIEKLRQGFQKEEESLDSAKRKFDELEKERRKKERLLEDAETKQGKYNTQLLSVKTNKEYTTMLHEIEECKDGISNLEEEILRLFDQQEDAQRLIKEEKQTVDEKKRVFEKEKVRIEAKLIEVKRERNDLESERNDIEKKLEGDLLKEYHKLSKLRRGIAVARAKDGSCLGCTIKLMPQLFQEIKKEEDRIFRCPNCHRILFYKKEDNE